MKKDVLLPPEGGTDPEPRPWGSAALKVTAVIVALGLGGISVALCRDRRDEDQFRKASSLPQPAGSSLPLPSAVPAVRPGK